MVKKLLSKFFVYFFLLLMYVPILVLIIYSFTDTTNIFTWSTEKPWYQLYVNLFQNEEAIEALLNTILIAVSSALVSTILGTLGAIGIFYSKKKSKQILEFANQIPVINPEIVMALSLILLFTAIFHMETSFLTLLIGHVVLTAPFVVLSIKPKLLQMDPNLYEAALDLGATPAQALFKVIIPDILPGMFSGFMMAITLSLDDYIITAFTKDSDFQTLSTMIQDKLAKGSVPNVLRALTTLLFVTVLVVLIIVNIASNKKAKEHR